MIQSLLKNKKILLASKSPRRQELLKSLGIDFEIVSINSDESWPAGLKGAEITEHIAVNKSKAFRELNPDEILITADTIVWLNDKKIGKPKDEQQAFEILSELSDQTHQVFTSVCVRSVSKTIVFSDGTDVIFDKIDADEINYYIKNYQPMDKAGAYGIQDWLGFTKIIGIKGDYYNVMGLPLRKLYQALKTGF